MSLFPALSLPSFYVDTGHPSRLAKFSYGFRLFRALQGSSVVASNEVLSIALSLLSIVDDTNRGYHTYPQVN